MITMMMTSHPSHHHLSRIVVTRIILFVVAISCFCTILVSSSTPTTELGGHWRQLSRKRLTLRSTAQRTSKTRRINKNDDLSSTTTCSAAATELSMVSSPIYWSNNNQQKSLAVLLTKTIPRGGGATAITTNTRNLARKPPTPKMNPGSSKLISSSSLQTLKVGFYFAVWYMLNIYYNIINKKLLNIIPSSLVIGTFQLGVGAVYALLLWMLKLRPLPIITSQAPYWYVGICHAIGQLCSMVSLMAGPVSFTHIVKALEPFFSAGVSALVVGEIMKWQVYMTLIPVVGGVGYACLNEKSFSWIAFYSAMASNVAFALRAVLSKIAMTPPTTITTTPSNRSKTATPTKNNNLTPTNIFALVTVASFIVSIPIAYVLEGSQFGSIWNKAILAQNTPKQLIQAIVLSGLVHYWNNEVMYLVLGNVHPITLAVGNTMKRVFIIFSSVLVFHNPVSIQAGIGSCIGIAGVLLYSLTKQYYDDEAKKQKATTASNKIKK